jgi:hypothetical protein
MPLPDLTSLTDQKLVDLLASYIQSASALSPGQATPSIDLNPTEIGALSAELTKRGLTAQPGGTFTYDDTGKDDLWSG